MKSLSQSEASTPRLRRQFRAVPAQFTMLSSDVRPSQQERGALTRIALMAVVVGVSLCLADCGSPSPPQGVGATGVGRGPEDCDDSLDSDNLAVFAKKCAAATGEDVPAFNCDNGTLVPEGNVNGSLCDFPNVLNQECDPGSRFQVLKQTNDVEIVGHCRKKGLGAGQYGDIAVIQYNQKNGATCFYQALGTLSANVTAPSEGNGPGKFPWLNPKDTAAIRCVRCHDNGPFIRSEYLAQLRNETKNRLPGTNSGSGHWDQRFSWNQTIPYGFVGNDFQSWKVYSVSVMGTGSACLGCHRLGLSSIGGSYLPGEGTAQHFGPFATAMTQPSKNPHSANSPIWMTPGAITYNATNETNAKAVAACAQAIVAKGNDPNAPNPPSGCQWMQYGQGNTCRNGPIEGTVNGPTQSDPTSSRIDNTIDLGSCTGGDCPIGFCYWRTLHGPFWQTSPSSVPLADPAYRGSFVRIFGENGKWKLRYFSDPTGGPPNAPPGGTWECTNYNDIPGVPDQNKCFANLFSVSDPDGTHASQTATQGVAGPTANVLSGLIGNVAQVYSDQKDVMRVTDSGNNVTLTQSHSLKPPSPLKLGPLQGESWINGCNGWTPVFVAKDVFSSSDVQLVPAAQSHGVRCFITGIAGAWSSTRNNATVQPFAEIYTGPAKDIRLRVSPPSGAHDAVGAYASCIALK